MKQIYKLNVLALLVFTIVSNCEALDDFTRLTDKAILTFQNRHNGGFITATNLPDAPRATVVTATWRDLEGQKFRDVAAWNSISYQLKPVQNMNKVIYYDYTTGQVYQDNAGLGLTNSQYWQFLYVGHGYHLIKNYADGNCLTSLVLGQSLYATKCNGSPAQQWVIHEL